MAEATRNRVRAAIEELGFVRNESARRLRQGRGLGPDDPRLRPFGVVVEDLANPYATDVARGAEQALNAAGRDVLWLTNDNSAAKERRCLELLEQQHAAGVLITPVGLGASGITRLRAAGMAVVLLDHTGPGVCSVRVDHAAGGAVAARHLIGLGRERVAFVTGNPHPQPCQDRLDGAARALAGAGLAPPVTLAQATLTPKEGGAAARRLLALDPVPTGVFCANDLLAVGLVNELVRRGVRVPEDVAVVGYDDIELAASAAVPLTTIRQPRQELGRAAAELALAEAAEAGAGAHRHREIVLTPELVVRESA
ncbi:LacI family transcriptional regulator [Actinomadura rubrobrunea]|uniref:LacI family transcriptional regulator n=1 Tax=Actinomadura rubrobrunea TaxID=115335 RepID=A0A9W6UY83_9ACTN|nr:LacI family transcriptional regulator [Actinomadura rubrobrunea]